MLITRLIGGLVNGLGVPARMGVPIRLGVADLGLGLGLGLGLLPAAFVFFAGKG